MEIDDGRVLDALPAVVWTALPDGRIDFVNHVGLNTPVSAWAMLMGGIGRLLSIGTTCPNCSNDGDRS